MSFFVFSLLVSTAWASSLQIPVQPYGSRMVNGDVAEVGQFPWQVAIMGKSTEFPRYLCGGSLISDEWVLTAAHCVIGTISAKIYSGVISIDDPNATISEAVEFIPHEEYNNVTLNNDIGLIKLANLLTLNDNTQTIKLAEDELKDVHNVTLSGWGSISDTDTSAYSESLNYIVVPTMEQSSCAAIYGRDIVYPGLLCTASGHRQQSACLGDSGAGVVDESGENPVLVAVFSFVNGYGCEEPYPAGNSRTAFFRSWIKKHTKI